MLAKVSVEMLAMPSKDKFYRLSVYACSVSIFRMRLWGAVDGIEAALQIALAHSLAKL